LTVVIFGVRATRPEAFRLDEALIEATTIGAILRYLSAQLEVEFVPEAQTDQPGMEPAWFRLHEQGERGSLVGVYVVRHGVRHATKQALDVALLENDQVIVSSVA
jgi:hypothetical protein